MAYSVCVICDVCGSGYQWEDHSVSYSTAARIARKDGWSIGKRGWLCPACRKDSTENEKREVEDQ